MPLVNKRQNKHNVPDNCKTSTRWKWRWVKTLTKAPKHPFWCFLMFFLGSTFHYDNLSPHKKARPSAAPRRSLAHWSATLARKVKIYILSWQAVTCTLNGTYPRRFSYKSQNKRDQLNTMFKLFQITTVNLEVITRI